jgi:hypothetical protein
MSCLDPTLRAARWVALILPAACGGSGEGTGPTPNPVASVTISPPSASLTPQQTLQLSAVLKDAGGATLSDRQATWASSAAAVVTVNGTGMVSAIAAGTAAITATSEGKSGSALVTVDPGALVGPEGGTITLDGGAITITVPPGSIAAPTALTVTRLPQPDVPLPAEVHLIGPVYRLGPPGVSFAQPVTVTMTYDRSALPAWAMSGDLSVVNTSGGQWASLADIAVDGMANTVTGWTSGFGSSGGAQVARAGGAGPGLAQFTGGSDHAIQALNPHALLTPTSGSVNFQQRSAVFRVGLVPRGAAIPSAPVTQPAGNPGIFKYRWSTTGNNGVLDGGGTTTGWTTRAEMAYIATNPVLDQLHGQIDMITVEVLLNPAGEQNPSPRDIATTSAAIDADLQVTFHLVPDSRTLGRGEAADFALRIRDRGGNFVALPENHEVGWYSTANHGDIPPAGDLSPTQTTVRYTAHSTFNRPPPRADALRAMVSRLESVTERVPLWGGFLNVQLIGMMNETRLVPHPIAEAGAIVTIDVPYQVRLDPASSVVAPGATRHLEVSVHPDEIQAADLVYRYVNTGRHGTIDVANNVQTPSVRTRSRSRY